MALSGQQRKELFDALIDAFPNTASLEQMLSFELDKSLRAIAGEGSLQDIVFKLIQTAIAQGWVEDLVRGACNSNSGNLRLLAIAEGLLANQDPASSVYSPNIPQFQNNHLQKILILAAIPHGLRLDKEIREIEEAIRRATNRDLFEIKVRTAVRPQDIRRAIAEEQPQIVHFCGHGLKDGSLLLEDDGGKNKPVATESLASLFKLHADYVKCVLLNACYSEKPAIAISQYINYAIGMNQPIEDGAAIAFAQGFYDGLGYKNLGNQEVFQRAFDEGMVAIEMENLSQGAIPVLKKNMRQVKPQPEIVQSWQTINLSSDCGLNYTRLRDLLKARQWKEADEETHAIMLKLAEKEGKLGFQIQDINRLPNRDIWTIDQLWVNFSNKVFGFSIQKSIYEYEDKDFTKFAEKVGWKKEKWLLSPEFISEYLPAGYLPASWLLVSTMLSKKATLRGQWRENIFSSLMEKISSNDLYQISNVGNITNQP